MRSWIPLSPCAETRLFVEIPCFASISGCPCSHEALSLYILFCICSWYPNLIRCDLITFFRLNSHLLFDLLRLNAFQSHFYVVFCIYRFLACPSIDPSICGLPLNFSVRTFIGPFLLAINCAEASSLRTNTVPAWLADFSFSSKYSVYLSALFCLPLCIVASRQAIHRHRRLQCRCLCTRPITTKIENSFWIF